MCWTTYIQRSCPACCNQLQPLQLLQTAGSCKVPSTHHFRLQQGLGLCSLQPNQQPPLLLLLLAAGLEETPAQHLGGVS
jgi:hypothetical protein